MRFIGPKNLTLASKLRPETAAALDRMLKDYPTTYSEIWEELKEKKLASDLRYWVAIRLRDDAGVESIYDCFWKVG